MFSLQTMFRGKGRIFDLLQESSAAAVEAANAASALTADGYDAAPALASCTAARRREKDLAAAISQELVDSFVTVLDREDVESMNAALYRIPKTIGKFAERYELVGAHLDGIDLASRASIMLRSTEIVAEMIAELRRGFHIGPLREMQRRLQALESEADELLLEPWRDRAMDSTDPLHMILAKDLLETIEAAIDRCRDAGNVVYGVALKNA